jgi:hypothetical protein
MNRTTMLWAGAALFLIVAGALVSFSQRDKFGDDQATQPKVDATVEALTDCRWGEAGCILAQGIERALLAENVDVIVDEFSASTFYICPGGQPQGPGGPFPLCDGAQANEGRTGYQVGRRYSEGAIVNRDGLKQYIQRFLDAVQPNARDAAGSGGLRLYSFSCSREAFAVQNVSCARLGIIFSAIIRQGGQQRREALVFWAVAGFSGKTLPVTEVWDGMVFEGEVPVLFESGGELSDLGVVDVIDRGVSQSAGP